MTKIISLFLILLSFAFAQETGARYLIITHDNYYNAVKPLADWKTKKGLKAKIVRLSEIGSSSQEQIRNYVLDAYNTWQIKPEYLLLVGSGDQLPFPPFQFMSYHYRSDNYYTNMDVDYKNEIIPGRFWVSDTIEAKTVVAKVLSYDMDPYLADSLWYKKGVTIVDSEPFVPSSDSVYWADARYVYNLMLDAGFVHIDSLAEIFGHTSWDVINAINDGRSYILFRGLGSGIWDYPFHDIYPEQMNNGFKLPIVVSGTCATIDGIGWWWLNAGTPEQPKGTVGFFGTTTLLMEAAELRSALSIGSFEGIFCDSFATLGKACENGRQAVYDLGMELSEMEYHGWTCLGDPEMTVWTTTPRTLQISQNAQLYTRLCTVSVNVQHDAVPVESALVCVMAKYDTTFYHYGRTNNLGDIEFIDTLHLPGDSVYVTVTGRNLKPYYGSISVHFQGGPYVLLNSFSISDVAGGNGDFIVNPGEDIEIPLWVMNWGDATAYNVSGVMPNAGAGRVFTLHDTIKNFGNIPSLDSAYTSSDGYNVVIANHCPDEQKIPLRLIIHDIDDSTWSSSLDFTVHAPILSFDDYYFPGDLKYTPVGDTNQLIVDLKNSGTYKAENISGTILSDDSFFVIIDSTSSFGTINPNGYGSNQSNPFTITTVPMTPLCHPVEMQLIVTSGVYCDTLNFTLYVGQKDYLIWDPDPNHTSGPIIKSKLDSLDFYGDYTTILPYGYLTLYKSLFVCTGVAANRYVIKDTSRAGQEIEQYLVSFEGKVYIEGGDFWYGDPCFFHGYNFCPLFDIEAVANNIGLFQNAMGSINTFTRDMIFRYQGEATMLDHIDSTDGSLLIFRNSYNDKGCGVAANNRTVGMSFELGGFADSIIPSTKLILVDSIMKYFGVPPTGIRETKQFLYPTVPSLTIYPTVFRNSINICFNTGHGTGHVELKIYDVTGRLVKDFSLPTSHFSLPTSLVWDGTDDIGRILPEGVYFVRFVVSHAGETENYRKTEKIILLK